MLTSLNLLVTSRSLRGSVCCASRGTPVARVLCSRADFAGPPRPCQATIKNKILIQLSSFLEYATTTVTNKPTSYRDIKLISRLQGLIDYVMTTVNHHVISLRYIIIVKLQRLCLFGSHVKQGLLLSECKRCSLFYFVLN